MSEPKLVKGLRCRKCGRGFAECKGYLHRVNKKGVAGVWECRPSCEAELSNEEAIMAAIMAAIKGDK